MTEKWFEMADLRKKKLDTSVWIPLRSEKVIRNQIKRRMFGYQEEFLGHGSIMIPIDQKEGKKNLGWTDIGISHPQGLNFVFGKYALADDIYKSTDVEGIHLVLDQTFDNNLDNHGNKN